MRYKERIIEHNLHRPREYHTDSLKLQEVDFDSSVISHHPKSFEYYFTHGLVVNDRRYIVKEFFVKHGKLYAILTEDEDTYYEMYLSFLDENVIEDLKKDISDLKAKDKQFDKRLSDLENVRKQNQTLSINDRTISISGGNSIELPVDKDTIYDDTALKQRVKTLEDKPDKADQTLSINDRTISISGGNSIELPVDKDTIYDDTALKQRVKTLEDKPDKADQTLSINDRTISISGGNSIELPADKDTIYDDSGVKQRLDVLESKKYRVKGNGLFLDDDNTFHLEMRRSPSIQYPYITGGSKYQKLSPDKRTTIEPGLGKALYNQQYSIDNDGTINQSAVIEAGLIVDYTGSQSYGEIYNSFSPTSVTLSCCSIDSDSISGDASFTFPQNLKIETGIIANWNSDNKVVFKFSPRIVWTIITDSSTEHYTHFITQEELESEEPIEIEVKKNEEVVGRLNMTIKRARLFMQSGQASVLLKNPDDNKFYHIPRYK